MIEGIVKNILMKGIDKYAEKHKVPSDNIQIKVIVNQSDKVIYSIYINFRHIEDVTFLNIMHKKIDFLGYESVANPFMSKSIKEFSKEVDDIDVKCFIIKRNGGIVILFYKWTKFVKSLTLREHIVNMGV